MKKSTIEHVWIVGVILVVLGELLALRSKAKGDTITENFKKHWWSRGAMGSLLTWALWHFLTDTGGRVDFVFLGAGFGFGVVANKLKLRPSQPPVPLKMSFTP